MRRLKHSAAGIVAAFVAGCGAPSAAQSCDRACLIAVAESYLAAIAAHDASAAPLADDAVLVENVTRIGRDQGIFAAAAGEATTFRIYVPDPIQGSVGLITVLERRGAAGVVPAQLAVRLKVANGKITEAEHLVADLTDEADPDRLVTPRPHLIATVPEAERMPRTELASIAGSYYDALVGSDGTLAPFAPDCERQENGMITASYRLGPAPFDSVDVNGNSPPAVARDCVGQMSSRRFAYIDSIDNRRVFAIDPVQGLAMGLSHFRQSMRRGPLPMMTAEGSRVLWQEKRDPYDLPAAHIFKITDGQIHQVEAVGIFVPYGSPTGWE